MPCITAPRAAEQRLLPVERIHLDDRTLEFELPKQFLEYSSFVVVACG